MAKVTLLREIREGIQFNSLGKVTNPGKLKISRKPNGRAVEFRKGEVIEMSETSAAKYIEAGVAEAYVAPAA